MGLSNSTARRSKPTVRSDTFIEAGDSVYFIQLMIFLPHFVPLGMPMIDKFNHDPEVYIFLISTLAGGTGLNLTSANKVVVFGMSIQLNKLLRLSFTYYTVITDPNWSLCPSPRPKSIFFIASQILPMTFKLWIAPTASVRRGTFMSTVS